MKISHWHRLILLLIVLGGTVGCDQTTKHIARTKLNKTDSVLLMGGRGELRLAENSGAFLSLGASLPKATRTIVFTLITGIGLLGLLTYLLLHPQLHWLAFIGLSLIVAGGGSNWIDRLTRQGLVTDFITLRWGALQTGVFNVADVLVMCGVGLLLFACRKQSSAPATRANK